MPLTESALRAAKPKAKRYRLTDGGGLVLDVTPKGKKVWRYRYQRDGKDAVLTLGEYPVLGLLDAREAALTLKRGQTQGEDPAIAQSRAQERRRTVASETFEDVARAFLKREKSRWAPGHYERFQNRMARDVFPVLGGMHPRSIRPIDVTRAVAGIEARGAQNTALRVVNMIGQVQRYAVAKGFADRDVTADLKGGLDHAPAPKHRAAVLDRVELGRLLADIWDWPEDTYGKPLLQLCAYSFQRPGEIAAMRWADVDLDAGLWTYTVTKVDIPHAVPLSRQAVEILRDLQQGTGRFEFVFYSRSAASGYVSPQIPVKLLGKIGWRDRQTPHGFRAVARTLIAEDLQVPPAIIEHQLSHTAPGTALGRAYNRATFLAERTDMMQRYADHLDALREAAS